jgi:hypothetical protein
MCASPLDRSPETEGSLKKCTMTMEVSEALERVDNIVKMLDEICDHMDGFSSAEEAWLSQHH